MTAATEPTAEPTATSAAAPVRPDLSDDALARVTAALAETAAEDDRSGAIPERGLWVAHRAGLLTATVARRHGGAAVGVLDSARILLALGEGDPSVALLVANNLQVHRAQGLHDHWPPGPYADLLHRSAHGPALANAVRAEPELGAPARGGLPATTLTRYADGWTLSGDKSFATGGRALAYHLVWVSVVEPGGDPRRPRVGHAVVPADRPGITWTPSWDHLGLRASNTHDVGYRDVRLDSDAFIEIQRDADGNYRDPAATPGPASLCHSALYVGVARAARAAFAEFARERTPSALGRPIATTERIQAVAGEIDAQVAAAETLLFGTLLRAEAEEMPGTRIGVIKAMITRGAIAAVELAVRTLGNPGLTRHRAFERHLRDVLCARVHPPQEDAAFVAAGRRLLGC